MCADSATDIAAAQTNDILRQILRWIKFQSIDRARQVIEEEVAQDAKRVLVFELTDGERGRPEVSRLSGVASSTVQLWWDRWYKLGILEPSPKRKGMVRKLCGIEEVGLEIPKSVRAVLIGKSSPASTTAGSEATEIGVARDQSRSNDSQ